MYPKMVESNACLRIRLTMNGLIEFGLMMTADRQRKDGEGRDMG